MKDTIKTGASGAGIIAAIVVAIFALALFSYGMYAYFAPRYTAVDYKVFKQSQQYNDGMANRLSDYQQAYATASTDAQKAAIRSIVRHEFASYQTLNLPPDLQAFLAEMKGI